MLKSIFIEPAPPIKPCEPMPPKEITQNFITVPLANYKPYNMEQFKEYLLSQNIPIEAVWFQLAIDDDGFENNSIYYIEETVNKNYDSDLEVYNKKLEKYKLALEEYHSKLEEYKLDLVEFVVWKKNKGHDLTNYIRLMKEFNICQDDPNIIGNGVVK